MTDGDWYVLVYFCIGIAFSFVILRDREKQGLPNMPGVAVEVVLSCVIAWPVVFVWALWTWGDSNDG